MKNKENIANRIFVVLIFLGLIVCLIPLLKLTRFAIPYYDDYGYARPVWVYYKWGGYTLKAAIAGAIKNAYTMRYAWQGTYGSITLMGLVPLIFGEQYYFLGPMFIILIFLVSIFAFTGVVVRKILKGSFWNVLGMQSGMAILMIMFIYTAQQGFYWYNGGIHYIGMFSFELIYLSLLIIIAEKNEGKKVFSSILRISLSAIAVPLAFFVAGANFITVLQTALVVLSIFVLFLIRKKYTVLFWLPSMIVYAVGFYFNVTAPGNAIRAAYFTGVSYPPVKAVLYSFVEAFSHIKEYTGIRTFLMLLIIVPVILVMTKPSKEKTTDGLKYSVPGFIVLLLWSICIYAATFTPGLYGFGGNLSRMENVCKATFQILLVVNLIYLSGLIMRLLNRNGLIERTENILRKHFKVAVIAILLFGLVWVLLFGLCLKFSHNRAGEYSSYGAYYYLSTGEAFTLHAEYEKRVELLKSDEKDIVFEEYSVKPWFLIWKDISSDPYDEPNTMMEEYYGKNSIVAYPSE